MSLKRYSLVLLAVFLALAGANKIYTHAVRLSCWSGGYAQDGWLAYCNSPLYGVFDPDAIWFRLEPEIESAIHKARVLTLSDSHLQNALSLGGASEWFAAHKIPAYFLGLPVQQSGFGEALIDEFKPEASVVVFSASPYFTGKLGNFLPGVLAKPDKARADAVELQGFQKVHRQFCAQWPSLCGYNFAYYRSRKDGHWIFPPQDQKLLVGQASLPNDRTRFPTSERPDELRPLYPAYLEAAERIVAKLKLPRQCIVIANVPTEHEGRELAELVSTKLGLTLIDPKLTDLATFDRSHLTPDSATRWTAAFLEQLEPVIKACVPQEAESPAAAATP